jgi:hypothetical protein
MTGGTHLELTDGWLLWRTAALRAAGMPCDWLEPFATDAVDDAAAAQQSAEAVRQFLRHEPAVAAIAWQNPGLMDNWVTGYVAALTTEERTGLRRRSQREAKIAKYAQRYCAKNDTIGFFGPVGWATLDDDAPLTTIVGSGKPAAQSVFLEVWALDRLAARWSADPRLLPHLPVRVRPPVWVHGRVLRRPRRDPEELSEPDAALLAAIGSGRSAAEVVAHARGTSPRTPDDGDSSWTAGAADLLRLRDDGVVEIGFTVPIDEHPEQTLAAQVARVPDEGLRDEMLARLRRLTDDRDEVAAQAGDGPALAGALGRLHATVRELTGAEIERVGRYGRAAAYLDCRRDLGAVIGADAIDRLRAPLGLLLDSARWLADEVAREMLAGLADVAARLARRRPEVTLADLQLAAVDLLSGAPGTAVDEVAADFRLRWNELIPSSRDTETRLSTVGLSPLAAALFPAPQGAPRWAIARYHSPDLMLGHLDGPDAPPVWVLGELHVALNTLENRVFHTQSADRQALLSASTSDLRDGRILPLYPNDSAETTPRTYPPSAVHVPDRFLYWSFTDDSGHPSGAPSLPAAGLLVTPDGRGGLTVTDPASGRSAGILEFFGEFVTAVVVNHFRLRGPAAHRPRIRVDDLVVARRSWRVPAADLVTLGEGSGHGRFALRRHLEALGVPRHAFYMTACEPKPSFVDLQAPLHLYHLDAAARRILRERPDAAHVDLSEMLPAPDQLWLVDPDGRRYTSELRIVAVDDRPGTPVVGF